MSFLYADGNLEREKKTTPGRRKTHLQRLVPHRAPAGPDRLREEPDEERGESRAVRQEVVEVAVALDRQSVLRCVCVVGQENDRQREIES